MSIRSGQMKKKNLTTGFFLNKQKPFLSLVFNQPWHGNSTHLSQNVLWLTLTLAKNRRQSIK